MFNTAGEEAAQPRNISRALISGAAANFGSLLIELENAPDANSVAAVIDSVVRATRDASPETKENRAERAPSGDHPRASRKERRDSPPDTRPLDIAWNFDRGSHSVSQTADLRLTSAPPQGEPGEGASPACAADHSAVAPQTTTSEQQSPASPFDLQPETNAISATATPQRSADTNNFSFELNIQMANRQLTNASALQGSKGVHLAALEQTGLSRPQSLAAKNASGTPQKSVRVEIPQDKPAGQSVQKFSVLIRGADQLVRLVVLHNGSQLKVAVHAGTRDLSVHLRESVPELLKTFDNQGFRAHAAAAPATPLNRLAGADWNLRDSQDASDFQGPHQHGEQSDRRSQRKALWNLARDLRETSLD